MFRNLFIIAVLLLGAFLAGWFKVNRDGDRTTIEINRDEIRNDTRGAIERGREFLDNREQTGDWNDAAPLSQLSEWGSQVSQMRTDQGVIQSNFVAPNGNAPYQGQPAGNVPQGAPAYPGTPGYPETPAYPGTASQPYQQPQGYANPYGR